mgnify:CR=1 FL=1
MLTKNEIMPSSIDSVFGLPWLRYIIDERCFESNKHASFEQFDDVILTVKEYANKDKIAISLSGGLDSMVMLHVFAQNTNAEVIAFHLNYNNRVESADEARFLKKYCETCGVELIVDEIIGMNRSNTKRSSYEKESRRIRFQNYRDLIEKHKCEGIHLAHHKGDIVENIFTNVLKNTHHDDLSVLKKSNIIDGVQIVRPFLGLEKDRLFMYADKFRIPYFKDSTPSWSCRGMMRNEIFPKLDECFGEQFYQNLLNFDKERSNANELISMLMKQHTLFVSVGNIFTLNVAIGHTTDMPIYFWTLIFNSFCENVKIKYFSKKSIINFYRNRDRLQTIVMSPDCTLYVPGYYRLIEMQLNL